MADKKTPEPEPVVCTFRKIKKKERIRQLEAEVARLTGENIRLHMEVNRLQAAREPFYPYMIHKEPVIWCREGQPPVPVHFVHVPTNPNPHIEVTL